MKARLSVGTVFLTLFFGFIAWGMSLPSIDYGGGPKVLPNRSTPRPTLVTMPQAAPSDTISFPGAVGGGQDAFEVCYTRILQGGDSLYVWTVDPDAGDAEADSWPSTMDSVKAHTTDVHLVVFEHGGPLRNSSNTDGATIECLYVAGQAAGEGGSEGILFDSTSWGEFDFNSQHIVLRYLRTRSFLNGNGNLRDVDHFIMDHMSQSHAAKAGGWQVGLTMNGDGDTGDFTRYVTSQYGLYAWPDADHPTINRPGGGNPRNDPASDSVTTYRDFMAGPGWRGPLLSGGNVQAVQGIGYNWLTEPANAGGGAGQKDFLGMYFKFGPARGGGVDGDVAISIQDDSADVSGGWEHPVFVRSIRHSATGYDASVSPDSLWNGDTERVVGCDDHTSGTDEWFTCTADGNEITDAKVRANSPQALYGPLDATLMDTTALTDAKVTAVTDSVGVFRILTASGSWTNVRDTFDSARIAEFNDSTGQSGLLDVDTLDTPKPAAGSAWTDADGDGMPATWESANGLSDADASDYDNDPDGDGWPNVFEFLHGTDPNVFTEADGSESSASPTYGSTRFILHAPVTHVDTFCPTTGGCGGDLGTIDYLAQADSGAPEGTGIQFIDVPVSIGSTTGRKMLGFVVAEKANVKVLVDSIVFDLSGGDQANFDSLAAVAMDEAGDTTMLWAGQYDIPDAVSSGSKTIRVDISTNADWSFGLVLIDSTATGTPEAVVTGSANQASSVVTSITTLTDGAMIVEAVGGREEEITGFTPDSGQTERFEFDENDDNNVASIAGGTETVATAGQEDQGWTVTGATPDLPHILLAIAPSGTGAASDTIFTARPNEDSIVPSEVQCAGAWYNSDTTRYLCVGFAADTPTTTTGLLDSAQADSLCNDAAWDCTPAQLKAITITQSPIREFFGRIFALALRSD